MASIIRVILVWFLLCASATAQTVSPYTYGMNIQNPTTTNTKVYASVQRIWGEYVGANGTAWAQVSQTSCVSPYTGCTFTWTAIDAIVAQAIANGQDVVYTFGYVPGWANNNAGVGVPPTTFADFYNYVTQIVTRYKGRIKYYETWNEANLNGTWSGTSAQMLMLAQNLYSTIHSIDPNAVVLTPSVTGFSGVSWMQQYLASGGAAYADVFNFHAYALQSSINPPNQSPEQEWLICQNYKAMATANSVTLPIFATEGGWFMVPTLTLESAQLAWAADWQILLSSCGINRMLWFQYDQNSGSGTLWDGANWLNPQGVAYRVVESWLTGTTWSAPMARVAKTNQISNTTMTGAVAGTPGTPPTGWSVSNGDLTHGITTEIVGTGTEGGVPYIDFRVYGTYTGGGNGYVSLGMVGYASVAALVGQQWTYGADVKAQAGSVYSTGLEILLTFNELNSGGSYLAQTLNYPLYPASASLPNDVQAWPALTTQATTAWVQPYLVVQYTQSNAIDVTLRIGAPLLDQGSVWSGTTSAGQIVWDAAGGPTAYSTGYTHVMDLTGQQAAVQGGSVTLTNLPVFLSNSAREGWAP